MLRTLSALSALLSTVHKPPSSSSLPSSTPTPKPPFLSPSPTPPASLQLLTQKLHPQSHPTPHLTHLHSLSPSTLPQYFSSKPIQSYQLQDIHYFLTNPHKFLNPAYRPPQLALICETNLQCYDRFLVADAMGLLADEGVGGRLMRFFNQACLEMGIGEFLGCLREMEKIQGRVREEGVNLEVLRTRVGEMGERVLAGTSGDLECDLNYLQTLYYLNKLQLLTQTTNQTTAKSSLQKLNEQLIKNPAHIKYLYFLDTLQPLFSIKLTAAQCKTRQAQIQKKILSAKSQPQLLYTLYLLDTYIQFFYILKPEQLNYTLYLQYLHLIDKHSKQNQTFQVPSHPIPELVISSVGKGEIQGVLGLRERLGLGLAQGMGKGKGQDKGKSEDIGKFVKRVVVDNVGLLVGVLKVMMEKHMDNNKLWMDFEIAFAEKLRLNSKNRDLHRIAKQQGLTEILKILAFMSKNKLGSAKFWEPCYHMVFDIVLNKNLKKKIERQNKNTFVICLFQVYQHGTIPSAIEDQILDIAYDALKINQWTIQEFLRLVKCLAISKFGRSEIWYAIEVKMISSNVGTFKSPYHRMKLSMIYQYFTQMEMGSFKFKTYMRKMGIANKVANIEEYSKEFSKKEVKDMVLGRSQTQIDGLQN